MTYLTQKLAAFIYKDTLGNVEVDPPFEPIVLWLNRHGVLDSIRVAEDVVFFSQWHWRNQIYINEHSWMCTVLL